MPAYPVTDLADYLRGAWDLAREIVDPEGAEFGTFTGTAEFVSHPEELCYREGGRLRLHDYESTATRTLHYRPEDPTSCTVWFDDGHFFHDLRLDTGMWQVRHPCRADMYHGWFEVHGPDTWQQHWSVHGPEKAYEMTTLFTRR